MKDIIDTIFDPLIQVLNQIITLFSDLSVPASRGLNISDFLPQIGLLPNGWIIFVETIIMLSVIYMITYVIMAYKGLFLKFKDAIKFW